MRKLLITLSCFFIATFASASYFVISSNGNWGNPLISHRSVNTPTLSATNLAMNASRYSATFTSPSSTSSITGVAVHYVIAGTKSTVATLQENSGNTIATSTITAANRYANGWSYFDFTDYLASTTTVGYYRIKFDVVSGGGTDTATLATDSGGTLVAIIVTYDDYAVPTTGDNVWIMSPCGVGITSVTVNGTQYCGNGADTTFSTARSIGHAVNVYSGGLLQWDTSASSSLMSKGNVVIGNNGELDIGTTTTYIPDGVIAKLRFDQNGVAVNYGLHNLAGSRRKLQGCPKSSTLLWKTKLSTGTGTVADPLVTVDAVNWNVGDEILVGATSDSATNYNESENKFILSKISATTYTLAASSGGAISAFSFTHSTNAWVLNIERNVIIESTSTTLQAYDSMTSQIDGDIDMDWIRFNYLGTSATSKQGVTFYETNSDLANCDYSVNYGAGYYGFNFNGGSVLASYNGIIGCNQNSGSVVGAISCVGSINKTLTDSFAMNNNRIGFYFNSTSNVNLNNCYAISNNKAGNSTGGGYSFISGRYMNLVNCEAHCNALHAIRSQVAFDITFEGFNSGTKGTNVADFSPDASSYQTVTFINSNFGSASMVSNYLDLIPGAYVRFHGYNNSTTNHIWYTPNGTARSSGVGLTDTINRTSGNFSLRIAPENATTGFTETFYVVAKASSSVYCNGYLYKNSAFGSSVATVKIYAPNSSTVMNTWTASNSTGTWQNLMVYYDNTLTYDAYSKVEVTGITATAGAYLYLTDIYDGLNSATGLKSWQFGQPSIIMPVTVGQSAWSESDTSLDIDGTTGNFMKLLKTFIINNSALIMSE